MHEIEMNEYFMVIKYLNMLQILRAMLHKKIYPQRPTTPNKCLDMGEEDDTTTHGSKWDKTDSECK